MIVVPAGIEQPIERLKQQYAHRARTGAHRTVCWLEGKKRGTTAPRRTPPLGQQGALGCCWW